MAVPSVNFEEKKSTPPPSTISCSPWAKAMVETLEREFDTVSQNKSVDSFVSFVSQLDKTPVEDPASLASNNLHLIATWALAYVYKTNNVHVQREVVLFVNELENAHNRLRRALTLFKKEGVLPESTPSESSTSDK